MDIIITCKNRLKHLQESLKSIPDDIKKSVFVVCYGDDKARQWCKDNSIRHTYHPASDFHLSKARNIGFNNTSDEWVMFSDADTIFNPDFFSSLKLEDDYFYTGEPECSGNCIVQRKHFKGYDEKIKGYGGEDTDLYISLTRSGLNKSYIEKMRYIPHSDMDRTRNYSTMNKWAQQKKNIQYLLNKHPHEFIFPEYISHDLKHLFI